MTFSRSAEGIKNYKRFLQVDAILFIEGKQSTSTTTYDERYYSAILETLFPEKKFKIKTVGNKNDALSYYKKINKNGSEYVCIDRDIEGITTSIIDNDNLIYTSGYSWENDFWSHNLMQDLLIHLGAKDQQLTSTLQLIKETERRLTKICSLDIGAQIHGKSLFKKSSKGLGININTNQKFTPSSSEFKRLKNLFKKNIGNCQLSIATVKAAYSSGPHKAIQGHLWEGYCKLTASACYKKISHETSAPLDLIKAFAFGIFSRSPQTYISPTYAEYLKSKIT